MIAAELENPEHRRMQQFIKLVLPIAFHKTVYEKQFIAKEARLALEQVTAKGHGLALPEAIDVLVEGLKESKNLPLTEQAALYLPELVKRMPLGYFSVTSESLKLLLQAAGSEALSKRQKVKKGAL